MNTKRFPISLLALIVALFPIIISCDDDNDVDPATAKNRHVNDWILGNMQYFYYWNEDMNVNADANQTPDQYFTDLLVSQDRFSWIQDNYEELLNSLNGISKEAGFEFVLYRESETSNNVIAQIVYVKPNSPASAADFKRGDLITHINGTQITMSNYTDLLGEMGDNHTLEILRYDHTTELFAAPVTVDITPVQYVENPNYFNTVINVEDRKIGYFVYNFFSDGSTAESEQYNNEMDQIFAAFKAQGITDIVVDLRFNSGGSESSANNLASLLGKVSDDKIFSKRSYNDALNEEIINDPDYGADFLVSKFKNKPENIGPHLTNERVYILTSSRTASASELVINALEPFMDVYLIGNTTYGKNVGSFSLYDDNDPSNTWGMQPIVVKMFNSLDQSDYEQGFTPDVVDADNNIILYPLGDPRERLLSLAIEQITGNPAGGRISAKHHESLRTSIGHSLDSKRRSFRLIVDDNNKVMADLFKKGSSAL